MNWWQGDDDAYGMAMEWMYEQAYRDAYEEDDDDIDNQEEY